MIIHFKFLSKEDIGFVSSLPYTITIPELKVILVHAGIDPNLSLIEQHPDHMVRMRNMVHGQPTHLIQNGTQWAHVYQKSNKVRVGFKLEYNQNLDFANYIWS